MLEAYVHAIHEMESRLLHEKKTSGPNEPHMQNTYSTRHELSSCQVSCSCAKTWNQGGIPFFFSSPSPMNSLLCWTLLVLASLFCISSFLFFFILLNYLILWMLMLVAKEKEFHFLKNYFEKEIFCHKFPVLVIKAMGQKVPHCFKGASDFLVSYFEYCPIWINIYLLRKFIRLFCKLSNWDLPNHSAHWSC